MLLGGHVPYHDFVIKLLSYIFYGFRLHSTGCSELHRRRRCHTRIDGVGRVTHKPLMRIVRANMRLTVRALPAVLQTRCLVRSINPI